MKKSIYKSPEARETLMRLYDKKLASLPVVCESRYIDTLAGSTHVLIAGREDAPPLVLLHGINAGAPLALEAISGLADTHRIYAIDSIGQTTRSAETRLPLADNSLGKWLTDVLNGLHLAKASVIGVSYGAFLANKLVAFSPDRVQKLIYVVPGGLVNGAFGPSMKQLTLPLLRFLFTKKDEDLKRFINTYYSDIKEDDLMFQRTCLLGVNMDYRRPPLLQAADTAAFQGDVYCLTVDDDVFFPGGPATNRCRQLFRNFKEGYVLQNSKHMPSASRYAEIESVIKGWLMR